MAALNWLWQQQGMRQGGRQGGRLALARPRADQSVWLLCIAAGSEREGACRWGLLKCHTHAMACRQSHFTTSIH
jgi:hypothetical protein